MSTNTKQPTFEQIRRGVIQAVSQVVDEKLESGTPYTCGYSFNSVVPDFGVDFSDCGEPSDEHSKSYESFKFEPDNNSVRYYISRHGEKGIVTMTTAGEALKIIRERFKERGLIVPDWSVI